MSAEVKEKLWNRDYLKVLSSNFLLYMSFMLLMPILPLYLSDTFHAGKDVIGVVLSGYTVATLVIRLFSGYIVDTLPRKAVIVVTYLAFGLICLGYLIPGSIVLFAVVRTLHGLPFGSATVATSTAAIDVLPSSRRAEGIGYYGLSNNVGTAVAPSVALLLYSLWNSYNFLFLVAFLFALIGFIVTVTIKLPPKPIVKERPPISLDRFFLLKGWSQSLTVMCFSFAYGILSTYVAIYGREEFGVTNGAGIFFALFAGGLFVSRLTGGKSLGKGKIAQNAGLGIVVALVGYVLFAAIHNIWCYYIAALIIGLGNGHMYPAFQNMFVNLATNDQRGTANSSLLVSWDVGFGLGILIGGIVAEHLGLHSTFWTAVIVNAMGTAAFFLYSRGNYLRNKLR
ncbi:MAG: MFS transporter [Bacteroidales bacterium]|nr:MFS transporter [Bacteroidales bacterium]